MFAVKETYSCCSVMKLLREREYFIFQETFSLGTHSYGAESAYNLM